MSFSSMRERGSALNRILSIILIQTFLVSNIAFAAPAGNTTAASKGSTVVTDPEKIVIPREYGLVKTKFTGKDDRLVIHIQDAHCNYEAQSNIAKILEALIRNDGLKLVSVEGADGVIDTSWFKAFPDDEVRKEVADFFMKKGEITGPEFLSITSDYDFKLFGAETRAYYIENLNAFTSSYSLKSDTEKYFNDIKTVLTRLKGIIYNEDLKAMDAKSQDYESKKLQFNDYVRFLQSEAEKHKINLRQYDNFFRLINVLIYEKKIDFNVTDKERSALIDEISKRVDKDTLNELVTQSLSFKVGKISSAEYYAYLKRLALDNDIDIQKNYPNLYNYIIYNSVYSKIENERLFNDIKLVETAIKDKLFANDDQRELEKLSRHIETLLGLVNIKLLNGDFEYFKSHKDEFTHEAFTSFIQKKTTQFGLSYNIEPPSDDVAKSIEKLEDFYTIAIKRDKALVDNTLNQMKKDKQRIAVLVTGGFHSEGISKLLEKGDTSYIVVCPSITKDVPSPYIQILTNQRTPIEDILVGAGTAHANEKSALAPPSMAGLIAIGQRGLKKYAKEIRNGEALEIRVKDFENDWIRVYINGTERSDQFGLINVKGYVQTMLERQQSASGIEIRQSIEENFLKQLEKRCRELTLTTAQINSLVAKVKDRIKEDDFRNLLDARIAAHLPSTPGTPGTGAAGSSLTPRDVEAKMKALANEKRALMNAARIQQAKAIIDRADVSKMEALLTKDTRFGNAVAEEIQALRRARDPGLEEFIRNNFVERYNMELLKSVLTRGDYKGYRYIMVLSSSDSAAKFKQQQLEAMFKGIEGVKIYSSAAEGFDEVGQVLGILANFERINESSGGELRRHLENGEATIAVYPDAGLAQRFRPMTPALDDQRGWQDLLGTVRNAEGDPTKLKLLPFVILNSADFANGADIAARDQHRRYTDWWWTSQQIAATISHDAVVRSDFSFQKFMVPVDMNLPDEILLPLLWQFGTLAVGLNGEIIEFFGNRDNGAVMDDKETGKLKRNPDKKYVYDTLKGASKACLDFGSLSISNDMLLTLWDYWREKRDDNGNLVIKEGLRNRSIAKSWKRDIDPEFIQPLTPLLQEVIRRPKILDGVETAEALRKYTGDERKEHLARAVSHVRDALPPDIRQKMKDYDDKTKTVQVKPFVTETIEFFLLNRDNARVFGAPGTSDYLRKVVGTINLGKNAEWRTHRSAFDAANDKLSALADLRGKFVKLDKSGKIPASRPATLAEKIAAENIRRRADIPDDRICDFYVGDQHIVLSRKDITGDEPLTITLLDGGKITVHNSVIQNSVLLPGSAIIDSIVEDSKGLIKSTNSYVQRSSVVAMTATNSMVHKVVSEKPVEFKNEIVTDVFRPYIKEKAPDSRFATDSGQTRISVLLDYNPTDKINGDGKLLPGNKFAIGDKDAATGNIGISGMPCVIEDDKALEDRARARVDNYLPSAPGTPGTGAIRKQNFYDPVSDAEVKAIDGTIRKVAESGGKVREIFENRTGGTFVILDDESYENIAREIGAPLDLECHPGTRGTKINYDPEHPESYSKVKRYYYIRESTFQNLSPDEKLVFAMHEEMHIKVRLGIIPVPSGMNEEEFVNSQPGCDVRLIMADIGSISHMEDILTTDTRYGTVAERAIKDLRDKKTSDEELNRFITDTYVRRLNIIRMKQVLSTEPYRGYDIIIISSSTPGEAEYQKDVLERAFKGVYTSNKALNRRVCILSVLDESEGGQIIGQVNTWKKASEQFKQWAKKNRLKAQDLDDLFRRGGAKIAVYHNGGKGERASPATQGLGNSRGAQKLVGSIFNARGEPVDLELILAVVLQTNPLAVSNDSARIDTFRANQVAFGTVDFTKIERNNFLFDKFVIEMPDNPAYKDLFDYGTGMAFNDDRDGIALFSANKVWTQKDPNTGEYAVVKAADGEADKQVIEAWYRKFLGAKKRFFDYGSLSISRDLHYALLDYWWNVKGMEAAIKRDGKAGISRDIDPAFIQVIVPLVNGLRGKDISHMPDAAKLAAISDQEKADFFETTLKDLLGVMDEDYRNWIQLLLDKDNGKNKGLVYETLEFFIRYRDTVFKDLARVAGYANFGKGSLWFAYKRLLDMANEKFVMLADLIDKNIEIGARGDLKESAVGIQDQMRAEEARRMRHIQYNAVARFRIGENEVVLTADQVREGWSGFGVRIKGSIIQGNCELLPGSDIVNSVINDSQGRIKADSSYVESSTAASITAVNSIVFKCVDNEINADREIVADCFRPAIKDGRFPEGQTRMRAGVDYDPKPTKEALEKMLSPKSDTIKFGDNAYSFQELRDMPCNRRLNDFIEDKIRVRNLIRNRMRGALERHVSLMKKSGLLNGDFASKELDFIIQSGPDSRMRTETVFFCNLLIRYGDRSVKDIASRKKAELLQGLHGVTIDPDIFKRDSVRAVADGDPSELPDEVANAAGKAYAILIAGLLGKNTSDLKIAVGRESRNSGKRILKSVDEGCLSAGAEVIDVTCGEKELTSTPIMYFASRYLADGNLDGIIEVTASHLSFEYNGLKPTLGVNNFTSDQMKQWLEATHDVIDGKAPTVSTGKITQEPVLEPYHTLLIASLEGSEEWASHVEKVWQKEETLRQAIDAIRPRVQNYIKIGPLDGLVLAADSGFGSMGPIIGPVLRIMGVSLTDIGDTPDYNKATKDANPNNADNLRKGLTKAVDNAEAMLGMGFDVDGDRLGVVTGSGRIWRGDDISCIIAPVVIEEAIRKAKANGIKDYRPIIVVNVLCSDRLKKIVTDAGGIPIECAVGFNKVKEAMMRPYDLYLAQYPQMKANPEIKTDQTAEMGVEISSHIMFKENFNSDDAFFAVIKLLGMLKKEMDRYTADGRDAPKDLLGEMLSSLPADYHTGEWRTTMQSNDARLEAANALKAHYTMMAREFPGRYRVRNTLDGIKLDFLLNGEPIGWIAIRPSGTSPEMVVVVNSLVSEDAFNYIKNDFFAQLARFKNLIKWTKAGENGESVPALEPMIYYTQLNDAVSEGRYLRTSLGITSSPKTPGTGAVRRGAESADADAQAATPRPTPGIYAAAAAAEQDRIAQRDVMRTIIEEIKKDMPRAVKSILAARNAPAFVAKNITELNQYYASLSPAERAEALPILEAFYMAIAERALDVDDVATSRGLQIMAGQGLALLTLIDQGVPWIENIRLTTNENDMLPKDAKGNLSYIDKNSIPAGMVVTWRGAEGIDKLNGNILDAAKYDTRRFDEQSPKMIMYTMFHVGGYHTTVFLHTTLPGSLQLVSTGPGHFQETNGQPAVDIKRGEGSIQFVVPYDDYGRPARVYAQPIDRASLTVAAPGTVDYMVNTGNGIFNDVSVDASPELAAMMSRPIAGNLKNVKPTVIPYYAVLVDGRVKFVANPKVPNLPKLEILGAIPVSVLGAASDAAMGAFHEAPATFLEAARPLLTDDARRQAALVRVQDAIRSWQTGAVPDVVSVADVAKAAKAEGLAMAEKNRVAIRQKNEFNTDVNGYTWGEPVAESFTLALMGSSSGIGPVDVARKSGINENGVVAELVMGNGDLTSKVLTSARPLSLQIHYEFPEMIIPLEDGYAYIGLVRDMTEEKLNTALISGDRTIFNRVDLKAGVPVIVPAGTIHAYGAVRVYEIKGISPEGDSKGTTSFGDRLKLNAAQEAEIAAMLADVSAGKMTANELAKTLKDKGYVRYNKDLLTMVEMVSDEQGNETKEVKLVNGLPVISEAKIEAVMEKLRESGSLRAVKPEDLIFKPRSVGVETPDRATPPKTTTFDIMGATESFVAARYTVDTAVTINADKLTEGRLHTLFVTAGKVEVRSNTTGKTEELFAGQQLTIPKSFGAYTMKSVGSEPAVVYTQYQPTAGENIVHAGYSAMKNELERRKKDAVAGIVSTFTIWVPKQLYRGNEDAEARLISRVTQDENGKNGVTIKPYNSLTQADVAGFDPASDVLVASSKQLETISPELKAFFAASRIVPVKQESIDRVALNATKLAGYVREIEVVGVVLGDTSVKDVADGTTRARDLINIVSRMVGRPVSAEDIMTMLTLAATGNMDERFIKLWRDLPLAMPVDTNEIDRAERGRRAADWSV